MQPDGAVQRFSLSTVDQLSRLTSDTDACDQQVAESHYEMQSNAIEARNGPKLEDFLGIASLGGQYSANLETQQQLQLQNIYYNGGSHASNYATDSQSQINVNLSYSQEGGSLLPNIRPFHVAYGGVPDHSSLTKPSNYDHSHSRVHSELQVNSLYPTNYMHAQSLLQVPVEQSTSVDLLDDCSLHLPQRGFATTRGNDHDAAELKTWLKHQTIADYKAGGRGMNALATLQPLSLSMSTGSHHSIVTTSVVESPTAPESRKRSLTRAGSKEPSPRKSIDNFGQRTSVYRGVTKHRWTGRYEAHLWDNSCRKEGQTRKGRQVYLGGYDKEDKAAKAYDLAALKYWGPSTTINFPLSTYETELEEMKKMSRHEYVASLRRKSSGFSRGASIYRGVTRHHQHGRWQARIGRVAGNKDLYLGTYSTQEEAAEAYDIAAIKFRGINAVTNFELSRYDAPRFQGATANGHDAQDAMKATKEAELVATATSSDVGVQRQRYAHAQSQSQVDDDRQTSSMHTRILGSNLTTEVQSDQVGLSKNLHEWQMLYQQQAQQQDNQDTQQNSFGQSLWASTGNQKFNPPNQMLLRNLMDFGALPQDRGIGESSCSTKRDLLGQRLPSSESLISSSGYHETEQRFMNTSRYQSSELKALKPLQYQSSDQNLEYQHDGRDRGALVETSKKLLDESEEASSKSSAYDPVVQGDMSRSVLYLPPASQGKLNNYDSTPLSSWIDGNPTGEGISGQSNLRVAEHMGSGSIFSHSSWNE